jgi:hypothetical protein
MQVLCRVAIQSRRIVRTSAYSTSPESLASSVHAIKPAGMTTIAVWISIMDTDIVIPGRPTHVHLIFWGRVVLACHADVVVSTSIAIWIFVPSPPTLRRRRIAAFEAEGCGGQYCGGNGRVRISMLLVAIILTVQPDSLFEEQRAQSEVLLFSRLCLSVRYGGDGFEGSPKVQSYAWWSSRFSLWGCLQSQQSAWPVDPLKPCKGREEHKQA